MLHNYNRLNLLLSFRSDIIKTASINFPRAVVLTLPPTQNAPHPLRNLRHLSPLNFPAISLTAATKPDSPTTTGNALTSDLTLSSTIPFSLELSRHLRAFVHQIRVLFWDNFRSDC
ncbi:hypothetical protein RIF29_19103 [Crotalaria pallida]|uniref:Uncharacterized protein n=1 Tax=Crotalaria pallida TaxID=3830 RepID=A0AAN9EYY5_CROPI